MDNNGHDTINKSPEDGAVQNGHRPNSSKSNQQPVTTIEKLNNLLGGAPVLSAAATSEAEIPQKPTLATAKDFSQIDEKRPLAHKVMPKLALGSLLATLVVLPMTIFVKSDKQAEQATVQPETSDEPVAETATDSDSKMEAIKAENEQLKAQQAFTSQQLDIEAIEAEGRRKQALEAQQQAATQKPQPTTTAQPVTVRTTTAPRPAPAARPTPAPRPTAARPAPQASPPLAPAREPIRREIPVDPYAQRTQLQALGVYGSPPPVAESGNTTLTHNPFEIDNGYEFIQAISIEQSPVTAAPAISREAVVAETVIEDTQYQEDAALVLEEIPLRPNASDSPEETIERDQEANSEVVQPAAILPGTSVTADIPYGFHWRQGVAPPEVMLITSEDIMAGQTVALPAGTQMLARAMVDPASGATELEIMVFFGDDDIQIPQRSIVVHAEDGSPLVAQSNDSPSTPNPNFSGILADSLSNGLSNVIDSNDNIAVDLAGGVAEAVIENQRDRAEAQAEARTARAAAQPITWTLEPGPVRLTFNNIVPLTIANQ
ncbi:MAG: hypothetical protein AAGE59_13370 [Cyanobacteria bacterium P01_F01_bin.86]